MNSGDAGASTQSSQCDKSIEEGNHNSTLAFSQLPSNFSEPLVSLVEILQKPPENQCPKLVPHPCFKGCLAEESRATHIAGIKFQTDYISIEKTSPYCVPLFFGWVRRKKNLAKELPNSQEELIVIYVAPCGKRFSSLSKLQDFLIALESKLSIDQFTFESNFELFTPREPFRALYVKSDVSEGKERVAIQGINEIDQTPIGGFEYITKSILPPHMTLRFDETFLLSCECTNNCRKGLKCQCHRLTREETMMNHGEEKTKLAGYKFRCLNSSLNSAVFECNHKCSCDPYCPYRLVQNGIKHCLQVFRTEDRGWGLRTLHDITEGSFICTYKGEIIDFESFGKLDRSNDYVAALDYIDSGRKSKRDFDLNSDHDSLWNFSTDSEISTPSRESFEDCSLDYHSEGGDSGGEDIEESSEVVSRCPEISTNQFLEDEVDSKFLDQVMDAKKSEMDDFDSMDISHIQNPKDFEPSTITRHLEMSNTLSIDGIDFGDAGRFLNHSCEPNCRIRNIFIETQDYRCPTLAFFSIKPIKAYEELTWDYHYHQFNYADSKDCKCGSKMCRKKMY